MKKNYCFMITSDDGSKQFFIRSCKSEARKAVHNRLEIPYDFIDKHMTIKKLHSVEAPLERFKEKADRIYTIMDFKDDEEIYFGRFADKKHEWAFYYNAEGYSNLVEIEEEIKKYRFLITSDNGLDFYTIATCESKVREMLHEGLGIPYVFMDAHIKIENIAEAENVN